MAHIYKSAGAVAEPVSPLARAPFDRQRDVFKLARMGSGDCRRLWNSFAEESPGLARLVVADVERERQEDAAATERIDDRLREAEKLTVAKSRKKPTPKALKASLKAADKTLIEAERESSNPLYRVWAEMARHE